MGVPSCPNCGTKKEISGLDNSIGGYQIYCSICGHNWKIS